MKLIVILGAVLLLTGCGLDDGGWLGPEGPSTGQESVAGPAAEAPAAQAVPAPAQAASASIAAHCRTVAQQRADDGLANGYSMETSHTIFEGTYRDCVTWDQQHSR